MVLVNFIVIWLLVLWPVIMDRRGGKKSLRSLPLDWCLDRETININVLLGYKWYFTSPSQHRSFSTLDGLYSQAFSWDFFNKNVFLCFWDDRSISTLKYQWKSPGIIVYTHLYLFSIFLVPHSRKEAGIWYKIEYFSRTNNSLIEHFHIPLWVFFFVVRSRCLHYVSSAQKFLLSFLLYRHFN